MWLWLSEPMRSHFGVGEFTTQFRTYFSGEDVHCHWGYDLAFDPWPCVALSLQPPCFVVFLFVVPAFALQLFGTKR